MEEINIGNYNIEIDAEKLLDRPIAFAIKRAIDLVLAAFLLLGLAPLFLIIAVLIKIEGGTVFFGSKRLGRGREEFSCLKFRTMIPDAEKLLRELLENDLQIRDVYETHRKIHNDPRITKIGIFLRKTSLDELPQLINVIKGEMSLVGPRPILLDEEEVYGKGQLRFYYAIRPGLTGLWQVSGRNNMTFAQRVNLDMKYIQNWSLWYDFIIFIRTFAVIISRSGAY